VSPRKLLIVTYHFPPSASVAVYRMLGFARHLPKFNWQTVVVSPPSLPYDPVDGDLLRQIPAETAVVSVPFPQGGVNRILRRFAPEGIWLPQALAACGQAVARTKLDAMLTSGPPHCVHLLGLYFKRRYRLPWVADFRDPWITNADQQPFRRSLGHWWETQLEKAVLKNADYVVANTPRGCAGFQAGFPQYRHKMTYVTNGYDPESFGPPGPPPGCQGILTILHAGELYSGRDPRALLDALQDLAADRMPIRSAYRLCFLGRSPTIDLPQEVHRRGLDSLVELSGQVPYRAALERMKRADILLLVDSPGRRVGVPAKVYEYLGAGRPILALADPVSDTGWVLRTSGVLHRVVPPLDVAGIKQALMELSQEIRAGVASPTEPSRAAPFTRERMAQDLAHLLDRSVSHCSAAAAANKPVASLVGMSR
jgi:glycosyltransferase involved in cell wall biosynthesis